MIYLSYDLQIPTVDQCEFLMNSGKNPFTGEVDKWWSWLMMKLINGEFFDENGEIFYLLYRYQEILKSRICIILKKLKPKESCRT